MFASDSTDFGKAMESQTATPTMVSERQTKTEVPRRPEVLNTSLMTHDTSQNREFWVPGMRIYLPAGEKGRLAETNVEQRVWD